MSLQVSNTPVGFEENEDVRFDLYSQYGNHVFESVDDFCDRMANEYGDNWIEILQR